MVDNDARALAQALCVLDPAQRDRARTLLEDGSYTYPDDLRCAGP
jgi:hypothetical protein